MHGNMIQCIFIYFYRCKIRRPTLIIFSKFPNTFVMRRKCLNYPDRFCFVCGKSSSKEHKRNITHDIKKMYMIYFGCPLGDQDKTRVSHKIYKKCCLGLHKWLNKRSSSMPFAIPMIWREPKDHCQNCYFCITKTNGFSFKQRDKIAYYNLDSATTPVPHNESMLPPVAPLDRLDAIDCSANGRQFRRIHFSQLHSQVTRFLSTFERARAPFRW